MVQTTAGATNPPISFDDLVTTARMRRNEHILVPPQPPASTPPKKVKDTVRASLEETGAEKVLLVAHSAGGWLARAALAEGAWEEGVASEDVVAGKSGPERRGCV